MFRTNGSTVLLFFIILLIIVFSSGCLNSLDPTCGDRLDVEKEFTLTKERPRAQLETPDASKECHAVMYLEYEYLTESMKITKDKPPIIYEFGTTTGWFPNPVSKMASENVSGHRVFNYWYATTSQGAKNALGDSTRYHIIAALPEEVKETPGAGVVVRMQIEYTPFKTG